MRIKVEGRIIEKTSNKTNYTHSTYSMILNNLTPDSAKLMHKKVKRFRFLTFTNIFIMEDKAHFYVAGEDDLINDFIAHLSFNQIVRIGDMVLNVINISPLSKLKEKEQYLFKTKLIINVNVNGKTTLCDDLSIVKERIIKNTLTKANKMGIKGNFRDLEIINPKRNIEKYKNGHINSWKCRVRLDCDYEVANLVYNVGVGENTATGHGFLWEV